MVAYIVQLKKKKTLIIKVLSIWQMNCIRKKLPFTEDLLCARHFTYVLSLNFIPHWLVCISLCLFHVKKKKNGEKKGKTRSKIFPAKSHSKRIWTQSSRAPKSSPSKVLQARTSATIFKAPRTWYIPLYFKYSVPQTFKTLKNYQEMQAFQNAKPTTQTMICLQK